MYSPVKYFKYHLSVALLVILSLSLVPDLLAQRNISYRELAMRNQQPPVYFDFIVLPGDNDSNVTFASVFSLSYNFLPFRKSNRSSSGNEFFSTTNLSMEVFKSNQSQLRKKREDVSIEGLESAGRTFWSDTAYAVSYEQSQSKHEFLSGNLSVSLAPGIYNYILEMKRGEQSDRRISQARSTRIEPYDEMQVGNLILGENLAGEGNTSRLNLISMGNNVPYGKDFYAFAYLPQYDSNSKYSLKISSLEVNDRDTTKNNEVYSQSLSQSDIKTGIIPRLTSNAKSKNQLRLVNSDNGYTYALLKIPNSTFSNNLYRLTIQKEGSNAPAARGVFRSMWTDMPTSLLNVDVAIDMLRYIASDKTISNLSDGSQSDRERKFREFWKERDPTPKTEFNELMAEYYRRVDYAYENFTTQNVLGFESDQGEVYIKFGPPKNIERKYPTNGPTTEIWTYPNRKFVFQATTGFGDFKLVSN